MIPRISRWLSWIRSFWVDWKGRWTAKRWQCAISTMACFTWSILNEMLRILWRIACFERHGTSPISSTSVRLLRWRCGERWMGRGRKREWAWCTISTSAICTKILSVKRLSISQARYSFIHTPFCSNLFVLDKEKPTAGSDVDAIQIKTRTGKNCSTKWREFTGKNGKAEETTGSANSQNGRTVSHRTRSRLSKGGDRCVGPLVTRWIHWTAWKERERLSFLSEEAQSTSKS